MIALDSSALLERYLDEPGAVFVAIHLAPAVAVPGDPAFLTFDRRQREMAVGLGLSVIVASRDAI